MGCGGASEGYCRGVACSGEGRLDNGNVAKSNGGRYPSTATYTCGSGYTLSGSSKRSCATSGSYTGAMPSCVGVTCASLSSFNGQSSVTNGGRYPSKASFSCPAGYRLSGSSSLTCRTNGQWSSAIPKCEPVLCAALGSPSNGAVSYDNNERFYPATATYSCKSGFTLSGSSRRTCTTSGGWTGSAPTCTPNSCDALDRPAQGAVSVTNGGKFPSKATYSCAAGYTLQGDATRTCLASGGWTGSAPSCRGVMCGTLQDPAQGSVRTTNGNRYPSQATFSCQGGYEVAGNSRLDCTTSGAWDGSSPRCSACEVNEYKAGTSPGARCQACPARSSTGGKAASSSCQCLPGYGGDASKGTACTICAQGSFKKELGNGPCQACAAGYTTSGEGWTKDCVGVRCEALVAPEFGAVSLSNGGRYPSTASITCERGFRVRGGADELACQTSGKWDAAVGSCEAVCGDGIHVEGEECDDKNTKSGDGCSADCKLEPGYACLVPGQPCSLCEFKELPKSKTVDCKSAAAALQQWKQTYGGAEPMQHPHCGTPSVEVKLDQTVGPAAACQTQQYSIDVTFAEDGARDESAASFVTTDTTPPQIQDMPTDSTVECDAIPSGLPAAGDDCDENPTVELSETRTDGACPHKYTLARTITATDACGNDASGSYVLTVTDSKAPVWSTAPQDAVFECDGAGNTDKVEGWLAEFGGGVARDSCDGAVTISSDFEAEAASLTALCGSTGSVTVTFTATDVCGNTADASAEIKLVDTTAPSFSGVPEDVTVECNEVPSAPERLPAADVCDPAPSVSLTPARAAGRCANAYTITNVWRAVDACGNEGNATQVVTVQDSKGPRLADLATDRRLECNASTATEIEAIVGSHAGALAEDECSGEVSWSSDFEAVKAGLTGGCGATGAATVTFTVTDVCGNPTTTAAKITVEDTQPPALENVPANVEVECDAVPPASEAVAASDACSSGDELSLELGEERTDGRCKDEYALARTWTATDACGQTDVLTQIVNVVDSKAPTFSATPSPQTTRECDGKGNTEEFEAWLSSHAGGEASDSCGHAVSWKHDYDAQTQRSAGCAATFTVDDVVFTVEDDCGNDATATGTFAVADTTAPVLAGVPADAVVECAAPAAEEPTATDVCDPAPEVVLQEEQGDPSAQCVFEYNVTRVWTAEDACGQTSSQTQLIQVRDTTPPQITREAQDMVVECQPGDTSAFEAWLSSYGGAEAVDGCAADKIKWTYDSEVELYGNYSGGCGENGNRSVTFYVADQCGNVASTTAVFATVDTTPPAIAVEAETVVHECVKDDAEEQLRAFLESNGGASASDACSSAVRWQNDVIDTVLCGVATETIVVFEASDECGNSAVTVGNLTIRDTEPPVIMLNGSNPEFAEAGVPWIDDGLLAAEDACHGPIHVNSSNVAGAPDVGKLGVYNVTYTIADECGIEGTAVRTVHVVDRTPPTITVTGPRFLVVRQGQELDDWPVFATDTFDGNVSVRTVPDLKDFVSSVGRHEMFYEASDSSGNLQSVFGRMVIVVPASPSNVRAIDVSMRFDTSLTASAPRAAHDTMELIGGRRSYFVLKQGEGAAGDLGAVEGRFKDELSALSSAISLFRVQCFDSGFFGVMCTVDASVGADTFVPYLSSLPSVAHIHQGSQGFKEWIGSYENTAQLTVGVVRQELERSGLRDYSNLVCDGKFCTYDLPGAGHPSTRTPKPSIMPMSHFSFDAVSSSGVPLSLEEIGNSLLSDGIVPLYLSVTADGAGEMHLLGARDPSMSLPTLDTTAVRETVFTRQTLRVDVSAEDNAGSWDVNDLLLRHGLAPLEVASTDDEGVYEAVFEQPVTNAQIRALESDNEMIVKVEAPEVELPPEIDGPVRPYSFVVNARPELVEGQPLQVALQQLLGGADASPADILVSCDNTTSPGATNETHCTVESATLVLDDTLDVIRSWTTVERVGSFEDRSLGELLRQAAEAELIETLGVEREQLRVSYSRSLQRARREMEQKNMAVNIVATISPPSAAELDTASFSVTFDLGQEALAAGDNASTLIRDACELISLDAVSVAVDAGQGRAQLTTSQYMSMDQGHYFVREKIALNNTISIGTFEGFFFCLL